MSIRDYESSINVTDTTTQELYFSAFTDSPDTGIVGYYPLSLQDIRLLKAVNQIIKNGHSANVCVTYRNFGINK